MTDNIDGKVVVITGVSSGLGEETERYRRSRARWDTR
jgi:NADP-dependent 3-hydroxy acid dehydrogenase YdfG